MSAIRSFRVLLFGVMLMTAPAAVSQEGADADAAEDPETEVERNLKAATSTYDAIQGLLETRTLRQGQLDEATKAGPPPDPHEVATRAEELAKLKTELEELEVQIRDIATGVEEAEFAGSADLPTDLKAELEQLFQPFVSMLKSATEEARQIEQMRRTLMEAERQRELASKALASLALLEEYPDGATLEVTDLLKEYRATWQERADVAEDQANAIQQQFNAKLEARESPATAAGKSFTEFFRERGVNLVLGGAAFLALFLALRLIGAGVGRLVRARRSQPFTTSLRAAALVYRVLTLLLALFAMLSVFNLRTDWLLLGITVLLLLGAGWTLVKMLPGLMEQITLLLNLGAVQEGERVIFDGIPWKVKRLAFYTVLVNPSLRGGDLVLPIRELIGLHSRPVAEREVWFPTEEGDWVLLEDDKIARVELQTPELVQMQRLGGAIIVTPSAAFIEGPAMNLSHGFRVELEFGIDYKHQALATTEILDKMRDYLSRELPKALPEGSLRNLEVEFFGAATSSLDYEIEVDLTGEFADQYEEVGRILSRLLVDACNLHGWEIPFQHITVHQTALPGAS